MNEIKMLGNTELAFKKNNLKKTNKQTENYHHYWQFFYTIFLYEDFTVFSGETVEILSLQNEGKGTQFLKCWTPNPFSCSKFCSFLIGAVLTFCSKI